MIQSMHKSYRSFSNSAVASVIRNEIKDLSPIPFESHLSSATAKHRELNGSNPQSNHLVLPHRKPQVANIDCVREEVSSDTKSNDGTHPSEIRIGGRIRRAHIQKSRVDNSTGLSAVGGRIIRVAPKASKFENEGGSVVAKMSATAKFRQRHSDRTGVFSSQDTSQETKKKSNPSSISILNTKPNAETLISGDESGNNNPENKLPLAGVGILLLGGVTGLFYSGVIAI